MSIKSIVLKKLSDDLKKYKIKSKSIQKTALEVDKTPDLIRSVLRGNRTDNYNIIATLQYLLEVEKKRIEKLSDKIDRFI
ncbi:hypothetical protein [Seonamhaeicola sp.]|uniref:hypothetical protein n=1 Tax=Seonamhaeicola sp. TaxID=1912245 RepID=UPI0035668AEB